MAIEANREVSEPRSASRPRVVIVGAGFGGLQAASRLVGQPVEVLLLDRNNYHGFWPLLYQVATAELDASHIAQAIRQLLRGKPNLRFQLATAQAVDRERRLVITDRGSYPYDELIIAAGSVSSSMASTSKICRRRSRCAISCSAASSARPTSPTPTRSAAC